MSIKQCFPDFLLTRPRKHEAKIAWPAMLANLCNLVRILLLNTMCFHAVVIRYLNNCITL